jgi:FtsP/CotA-like multicopper oxidase with cupredoxin domain
MDASLPTAETLKLKRRDTLKILAGLAAQPLLARITHGARPAFRDPPELPARRPEPGLVELDLEARPAEVTVAGRRAALWTYNGSYPGPVLRAREGDTVRVHFTNRIADVTNIHYHGMHVPPTRNADNIWVRIPPGGRFDYEFTVGSGEAGTYWYHPHVHGHIARQLWAGMAGPIVIESPLDAMPELAAADDRVVVLKDLALENGRPTPHTPRDWSKGKEGNLVLVNGHVHPHLRARAATLRLRLINAANARYFHLGFADGRPLHAIATDGHFLERPQALERVLLSPAQRLDVLVPLEDERPLQLLHLPYDRRASRLPVVPTPLLTIEPPPRPRPLALPAHLTEIPRLPEAQVAVRRRVTMAMFLLNGLPFDPTRVDARGRLGDLELWEVENVGTMDHNFHIHTWYFQPLARNGRPEPFRAWRDTENLRPGDRIELLIPLRSFPGRTVYHCHISEHGDKGMMAVIDVQG